MASIAGERHHHRVRRAGRGRTAAARDGTQRPTHRLARRVRRPAGRGRGFQVIRFDNRDAGLSTEFDWTPTVRARSAAALLARRRPKAGYLIADMAADAAALLRALDIGPAHVVGASMGGMIAQTMAIEHPDCVRSLTSIMSNTGNNRHGLPKRRVLSSCRGSATATIETRRGIVAERVSPGRRTGGRRRAVPQAGAGEPRTQLPAVGCPAPDGGDRRQPRSHRRVSSRSASRRS